MSTPAVSNDIQTALKALLTGTTTVALRPRYEGNNINTWIGFKHVNYLVEEAVLEHFRTAGLPSRTLFEDYGLGLEITTLDTRILNALHLDEVGVATVTPSGTDELAFRVVISKEGKTAKDVTANVRVTLRRETYVLRDNAVPAELAPFAVDRIGGVETGPDAEADVLAQLTRGQNAYGWRWRIPYPYCHNNERLQMSGYLRLMEEVVDLFLADRGISIKTLLDDRKWIPVVPHSRITQVDEAWMEEDLYTIYTVEEIFKDITYTSRMDTYVVRDGKLVLTSTGTITHGYAVFHDRKDWSLVDFDERVLTALRGRST